MSFIGVSVCHTFVAKLSKRYDRNNITHSTNHSVPRRGNTEQHTPEKVGSILQQIVDLLATATPDSYMSQLAVLRQRLMSITTMFTSLAQGASDHNYIYLIYNTYNVAEKCQHRLNVKSRGAVLFCGYSLV